MWQDGHLKSGGVQATWCPKRTIGVQAGAVRDAFKTIEEVKADGVDVVTTGEKGTVEAQPSSTICSNGQRKVMHSGGDNYVAIEREKSEADRVDCKDLAHPWVVGDAVGGAFGKYRNFPNWYGTILWLLDDGSGATLQIDGRQFDHDIVNGVMLDGSGKPVRWMDIAGRSKHVRA